MKIAVVGGGINGVMVAWQLAREGAAVSVFERGSLMNETSAASSKMLHGGIRYLEQGHVRLVREALQERAWWLSQAPHLARRFPLLIPVYRGGPRARWLLGAGVTLYDWLARGSGFPAGRWVRAEECVSCLPGLVDHGLLGAWEYWDAQMDDQALGWWAADQARAAGVCITEQCAVESVDVEGGVTLGGQRRAFDRVINATGPWAGALLRQSGVASRYSLDLVRGSHLVIDRSIAHGCVMQDAASKRVVFVLPHGDKALLGTTEVPQDSPEPAVASEAEVAYLKGMYQQFFQPALADSSVLRVFSGVRPIVHSQADPSRASRESAIERQGQLLTVWGGKWTTARALAARVAKALRG